MSRTFPRASAQQLQALQDRDLSQIDVVAVFLDGTTYAAVTSSAGFIVWSDATGNGGSVYLRLSSGGPVTHPFLSRNHL